MLLSAQKILHQKISDPAGSAAGAITGFFIIRQTGKIYAIRVDQERCILFFNIKNFTTGGIITFPRSVISIKDDGRVATLDEEQFAILGNQAITESGKVLGEIKDFEFDHLDGQIVKYYVKTGLVSNLFKGQLVIHKDQVVALKKEAVVVQDSILPAEKGLKIWQKKAEILPSPAAVAEG